MDAWLDGRRDRSGGRRTTGRASGGGDHQTVKVMIMRLRAAGDRYRIQPDKNHWSAMLGLNFIYVQQCDGQYASQVLTSGSQWMDDTSSRRPQVS